MEKLEIMRTVSNCRVLDSTQNQLRGRKSSFLTNFPALLTHIAVFYCAQWADLPRGTLRAAPPGESRGPQCGVLPESWGQRLVSHMGYSDSLSRTSWCDSLSTFLLEFAMSEITSFFPVNVANRDRSRSGHSSLTAHQYL